MGKFKDKKLLEFTLLISTYFFAYSQWATAQESPGEKDTTIHAKLLRFGGYLLILPNDKNYLQKDTVEVLDVGSMGSLCPTIDNSFNGDFANSEYNFFRENRAEEIYYDKVKTDSLIATLSVRLFEFDALVQYNKPRLAPKNAQHYFRFKFNNRMIVFKSFHYMDVKNIWLIRKDKTLLKFEECYHSTHSLLE